MSFMLNVDSQNAILDDSIVGFEYHTHYPYASTSLNNNDEIRIPVQQQDIYTLPSESYLVLKGTYLGKDDGVDTALQFSNNFGAFLFDEIRYEIAGVEVDRIRNAGITTLMKNLTTLTANDKYDIQPAGWTADGNNTGLHTATDGTFTCYIPLKMLLGFAEDYRRILLHVKQELILRRSATNDDAVYLTVGKTDYTLTLNKVVWKIPYVQVADEYRIPLLRLVDRDDPIRMAFRKWNLYEYPSVPEAQNNSWTVKSSAQGEKPRYVIVAFQTARKNNKSKIASQFDHCNIKNIKLYLNSVYYPYEPVQGDYHMFYTMFTRMYRSYYNKASSGTILSGTDFVSKAPLFVFDCSKQNETMKNGALDIKIEFESASNIPKNTAGYCLIISECVMQYTPLSGTVRQLT